MNPTTTLPYMDSSNVFSFLVVSYVIVSHSALGPELYYGVFPIEVGLNAINDFIQTYLGSFSKIGGIHGPRIIMPTAPVPQSSQMRTTQQPQPHVSGTSRMSSIPGHVSPYPAQGQSKRMSSTGYFESGTGPTSSPYGTDSISANDCAYMHVPQEGQSGRGVLKKTGNKLFKTSKMRARR